MNIYEELQWRGLIADCTHPAELQRRLSEQRQTVMNAHLEKVTSMIKPKPIVVYAGFDPTADSLHVGNLVPLLTLRRFQEFGHAPIAVAGGATGLIGDPSGKSTERQLLTRDVLKENIEGIKAQLSGLLKFEGTPNPAKLLDNSVWMSKFSFLDFLRDYGKHFSVNQMVAKESVRARMEDREVGISYTEFSYMLLQAYDFYHLRMEEDCELQIGGSDQWGNITAGIDLCRKKGGRQAFGLTLPLITNADGSKFGKSAKGAVWLDPRKTTPYEFYQYWIRTDDRDVIRFLKYFTFLDPDQINELEGKHKQPEKREAHRALAYEVTRLLHGEHNANEVRTASNRAFDGSLKSIHILTERGMENFPAAVANLGMDAVVRKPIESLSAIKGGPTKEIELTKLSGIGILLTELLVFAGLSASKGQARRDIEGKGIYLNDKSEGDVHRLVTTDDLLPGKHLLLRKGKRNYVVVTVK